MLTILYQQDKGCREVYARGIFEDWTAIPLKRFDSMEALVWYVNHLSGRWNGAITMHPADLGHLLTQAWIDDAADYLAHRAKEGPEHDL